MLLGFCITVYSTDLFTVHFQFPHEQRHWILCTFCGELLDSDITEVKRKGLPALREVRLPTPQGTMSFSVRLLSLSAYLSFPSNLLFAFWRVNVKWKHSHSDLQEKLEAVPGDRSQQTGLKSFVYKLLRNPRAWDNWGHFPYLFC